jgi:hypothetical protein
MPEQLFAVADFESQCLVPIFRKSDIPVCFAHLSLTGRDMTIKQLARFCGALHNISQNLRFYNGLGTTAGTL